MLTDILPTNATNQTVTWSVANYSGTATISPTGLLTAVSDGSIIVKAAANDGSAVLGTLGINISNQTIGIDNVIILSSEVVIYPNPTFNQLIIDTEQNISKVNIIDITGKIIMTAKENTNIINVADLSGGIYFIQLIAEEGSITKKFVKQ